jgi:hypothetical protein
VRSEINPVLGIFETGRETGNMRVKNIKREKCNLLGNKGV